MANVDSKDHSSIQKIWSKNRLTVKKYHIQKIKILSTTAEDKPCLKVKGQKKIGQAPSPKKGTEEQNGLEINDFTVDP